MSMILSEVLQNCRPLYFIQICIKYKYINFTRKWELCQKGFAHRSGYYKAQLYNFKIKSCILYELLFFKLFNSSFAFERMNFNIFLFAVFVFSDCSSLKISKAEVLVLHSLSLWLKISNWFWKHASKCRWSDSFIKVPSNIIGYLSWFTN